MQVILIGSGNIARLMGRILLKKGHTVQQVWSRNAGHAQLLATELKAIPVNDISQVITTADLYIVAVSDDALPIVSSRLFLNDKLVIHTSGTASREMLKNSSSSYGVIWPIKMVRSSTETLSPATMVIDGNNGAVIERIREAALLFSENITVAGDDQRVRLHLAATFTANFSNHLFHLASDFCEKENISFPALYPLIEATIQQLREQNPGDLQAGPAFRGDTLTIKKHRLLLENEPQMKKIYDVLTESILNSVFEGERE